MNSTDFSPSPSWDGSSHSSTSFTSFLFPSSSRDAMYSFFVLYFNVLLRLNNDAVNWNRAYPTDNNRMIESYT